MDPRGPRQRPAERSGQVRVACNKWGGGQCNTASLLINYVEQSIVIFEYSFLLESAFILDSKMVTL